MPTMKNDEMRAQIACAARTAGDAIVDVFGELLDAEIPLPVVIDQMITYGAFASVESIGNQATAAQFRSFADKIEAGFFNKAGSTN